MKDPLRNQGIFYWWMFDFHFLSLTKLIYE